MILDFDPNRPRRLKTPAKAPASSTPEMTVETATAVAHVVVQLLRKDGALPTDTAQLTGLLAAVYQLGWQHQAPKASAIDEALS